MNSCHKWIPKIESERWHLEMKPADVIDIVEKVIVSRAKGCKKSYCLFISHSHLLLEVLTIGANGPHIQPCYPRQSATSESPTSPMTRVTSSVAAQFLSKISVKMMPRGGALGRERWRKFLPKPTEIKQSNTPRFDELCS